MFRHQNFDASCSVTIRGHLFFPIGCTPPPCISYANAHNYYGPYAYCSLDKGVACAQHIQLPTYTCAG